MTAAPRYTGIFSVIHPSAIHTRSHYFPSEGQMWMSESVDNECRDNESLLYNIFHLK